MTSTAKGLPETEMLSTLVEPDKETNGFFLQQTMLRVKDIKKSLEFYNGVLGMRLLKRFDFPTMQFSLYFLGFDSGEKIPTDDAEKIRWLCACKNTVELTHNWGTENDAEQHYHNGNAEPKGFGHIGITVPDVDKACQRFEKLGVKFVKRPNDGKMKGIAFIQDPDGYWVEILNGDNLVAISQQSF